MPIKQLTFEGCPVREAKRALRLYPIDADKKLAKRGDPTGCVAAQAIKRAFDVEECRVYRSRVLVKPAGKKHWVRYETPYDLSTEALIFDRGGDFKGKEFVLSPLKRTNTSEYRAALANTKKDEPKQSKKITHRHPTVMTQLRGSPHFARAK